jgi:hypothetical protein
MFKKLLLGVQPVVANGLLSALTRVNFNSNLGKEIICIDQIVTFKRLRHRNLRLVANGRYIYDSDAGFDFMGRNNVLVMI